MRSARTGRSCRRPAWTSRCSTATRSRRSTRSSLCRSDSRLERCEQLLHRRERARELARSDPRGDTVRPGVLRDRNASDRPIAGLGACNEARAPVARIRFVNGEPALDEHVGDALDGLAGQAHATTDVGDRARLIENATEYLPPGRRDVAVRRELLCDIEEAYVEAKRGEDDLGQHATTLGVWLRCGPAVASRDRLRGSAGHDAPAACISAGNALGSARWKTPS